MDNNSGMTVCKNPSNLVEIPLVAEKYEMNSFLSLNAQFKSNLKTIEILKNIESGQSVLNFNAGFFGGVSKEANKPVELKDPFVDILERQATWQNNNK